MDECRSAGSGTGPWRGWPALLVAALALAFPALGAAPGVDSLIPALERIRGLKFLRPVEVREIRKSELRSVLEKELTSDLELPPDEYFEVLRDLRLIPPGDDPMNDLLDLYEGQVLAFYDPVEHVYYSIEDPSGPVASVPALQKAVAIHELMHAMQDQRFGAGRRLESIRGDWDAEMAYHALIEGEATLVMLASLAESSGGSLDDIVGNDQVMNAFEQAASLDIGSGAVPEYFVASLKFPYIDGLRFAIEAYRRGGWDELDRVHGDPPDTTEEIVRPGDYFDRIDGKPPIAFSRWDIAPGAGFETILGAFHWNFLLGADTSREWDGDRVVVMELPDGDAVLVETAWSSSCGAEEFAKAYSTFLSTRARDVRVLVAGNEVTVAYAARDGSAQSVDAPSRTAERPGGER